MKPTRRELLYLMLGTVAACQPAVVATVDPADSPARATSPSVIAPSTNPTTPALSPTTTTAPTTASSSPVTTANSTTASTPTGTGVTIEVIERTGWEAAAALPGLVPHTIERLTVHHTAVSLADNRKAPARLRAHQAFHQNDRGWPDLAYHFAIDRNGNVYEGRDASFRGDTATSYDPTGHLLVVLEGNFDEQAVPERQWLSLVAMLAWGSTSYGVPTAAIAGHRDYSGTSCPGESVYRKISDGSLRVAVDASLNAFAPTLSVLRGSEATARVAAIEAGTG